MALAEEDSRGQPPLLEHLGQEFSQAKFLLSTGARLAGAFLAV